MLKFKSYLTEAPKPKVYTKTDHEKWLKAYVKTKVEEAPGIDLVGSTRGGKDFSHLRFPVKYVPPVVPAIFSGWGLSVNDWKGSYTPSSKYKNYVLKVIKDIELGTDEKSKTIPKGTELNWVNSEISQTTAGGQIFANKILSPDKLGSAGKEWDITGLIDDTEKAVERKWPPSKTDKTAKMLIVLLNKANTSKDSISLSDIDFDDKDLAKISADFGEILSAIWVMRGRNKKQAFPKIIFPTASNNKLIDFYGIRSGLGGQPTQYPFSVKSGTTGGKVTVMNIIKAIKSRAKTANNTNYHELADQVFLIVENFGMKEQMIMLHQKFDTKVIRDLAKLMGHGAGGANNITPEWVEQWCVLQNENKKDVYKGKGKRRIKVEEKGSQSKGNRLLIKKLAKWHKKHSQPQAKTLEGPDLGRFIITSLGESIHPILNKMPGMAESLTRIAQQVALIQINVNVKTKTMTFASNYFKKADFKFAWAGYSGGNTLGFTMKMSK